MKKEYFECAKCKKTIEIVEKVDDDGMCLNNVYYVSPYLDDGDAICKECWLKGK